MKKTFLFGAIAALAVAGCKPAEVTSAGPGSGPTTQPATTGGTTPPARAEPTIPAELMHDGYAYFGLGNKKPINMQITSARANGKGTQRLEVKEIKDGKAIFTVVRDGDLNETLGDEEVSLEKDGVFTTKSTRLDGVVHVQELPAHPKAGDTWTANGTMNYQGKPVAQSETYKVIGNERVSTKVGTYDALKVRATGTATFGDVKYETQSTFWYVKDKGLVKVENQVTDAKHKTPAQKMLIQEVP